MLCGYLKPPPPSPQVCVAPIPLWSKCSSFWVDMWASRLPYQCGRLRLDGGVGRGISRQSRSTPLFLLNNGFQKSNPSLCQKNFFKKSTLPNILSRWSQASIPSYSQAKSLWVIRFGSDGEIKVFDLVLVVGLLDAWSCNSSLCWIAPCIFLRGYTSLLACPYQHSLFVSFDAHLSEHQHSVSQEWRLPVFLLTM